MASPNAAARPDILMDGHVHITNRVYWEGIDPWQPQKAGQWDYARARSGGINVIIDNVAAYGFEPYNGTVKQVLRLVETFHRVIETNPDKMALALDVDDIRNIVASGRMAVLLSTEAGFDMEGDIDVLRALHRLGLRAIQFASKSSLNAYADVSMAGHAKHYGGINQRGLKLVHEMNRLGIMIDLAHASEETQLQVIEASDAPVVNSHDTLAAISGRGVSDTVLKALAAKGGLIGIHGAAQSVSRKYIAWVAANKAKARALRTSMDEFLKSQMTIVRPLDDRGVHTDRLEQEFRKLWQATFSPWSDDPEAALLVPDTSEWAAHVQHVIDLVGPDHVAIGLDMFSGRSTVRGLEDIGGYQNLIEALRNITTPDNVRKIAGENWMRVLGDVGRAKGKN